jgi:hypothetical protein
MREECYEFFLLDEGLVLYVLVLVLGALLLLKPAIIES